MSGIEPIFNKKGKDTELPETDKFSVDGIGRNFGTPTQFNLQHRYDSVQQFVNAFLFPAQPPIVNFTGQFRLNGATSFEAFRTIEKGTIVNQVKVIASANSQVNSPLLKSVVLSNTLTPSVFEFEPAQQVNVLEAFMTVNNFPTQNSGRSFTAEAIDVSDVKSPVRTISYAFGNHVYFGKGTAIGSQINEAFVRSLTSQFNSHRTSVTATPLADEYIYYIAPVSFGLRVFKFLGSNQTNPEEGLRIKVRTAAQIANGVSQNDASVDEYFVVRSINAGLGNGSPYTFEIGTP
jgi:hypothetical protein